jgi:hypothetical protein
VLIWRYCHPDILDLVVCEAEEPHYNVHYLGDVTFSASPLLVLNRQTHAECRNLVTQGIRLLYQSVGCMHYDLRNRTPKQRRFIRYIRTHEVSFAAIDDADIRNAFPQHLARQWSDVRIPQHGERTLLPLRNLQDTGYQECLIKWEIEVALPVAVRSSFLIKAPEADLVASIPQSGSSYRWTH